MHVARTMVIGAHGPTGMHMIPAVKGTQSQKEKIAAWHLLSRCHEQLMALLRAREEVSRCKAEEKVTNEEDKKCICRLLSSGRNRATVQGTYPKDAKYQQEKYGKCDNLP